MRHCQLYHYRLPFQSGLVLKDNLLTEREGLLVRLEEDGKSGWGEIAPLPGFSQESLAQAEQQVQQWLAQWQAGSPFDVEQLSPSVAFGLSMAEYELTGKLSPDTEFTTVPLCTDCSADTLKRLQHQPLAKLKIGRASPKQDGITACRLLAAMPNLTLRLDANRAWSFSESGEFARQLPPIQRRQIAFIEEPCHTPAQSLAFAAEYGVAIAWDETTREQDFVLQPQPHLAAVILKPTLIGSVSRCVDFIQQARQAGIEAVISSSLESSLALTQLSRFATQHTPHSPAGLDTLYLMPYQLLRRWGQATLPLLEIASPYITQRKLIF